MLQKIMTTLLVLVSLTSAYICFANGQAEKRQGMAANAVTLSMTLEDFDRLNCRGLTAIRQTEVKHKTTDNRLRKYYRYSPPFSVVMKESDLKSYFELIFYAGKLVEINQYNLEGSLIKEKLNRLGCF